jgi:hypothetical protein
LQRFFDVCLALVILRLSLPCLTSDFAGVLIVSPNAILIVNFAEVAPFLLVQLPQLLLQLTLALVEIDQILLYEGFHIDLHVVCSYRIIVNASSG